MREALVSLAEEAAPNEPIQLAYVNPETGEECMPVLGFSAIMLRPGEALSPPRRSASCGYLVVEGAGEAEIDGAGLNWEQDDVFVAPTHAEITLRNGSADAPAFLIQIDDAPMQRKLGFYEVFGNGAA